MTKGQFKNWMGVVLAAVVLGLAVTFLIRLWKPEDAVHWLMWGVGILIALRSIGRIASLTKQINNSDKE